MVLDTLFLALNPLAMNPWALPPDRAHEPKYLNQPVKRFLMAFSQYCAEVCKVAYLNPESKHTKTTTRLICRIGRMEELFHMVSRQLIPRQLIQRYSMAKHSLLKC
ncbi:unnamed protein product, partial [Owenia fusiformis]